jgi:preprotein translocase subunit SecA
MERTAISQTVRNRVGWRERLARLQGSPVQYDLRAYDAPLAEITRLEDGLGRLQDSALAALGRQLRSDARSGSPLRELRAKVFAVAREAARRTLGLRPFDVQIVAALAMDDGAIVEMQTGEGKTLAAVLPAALNALPGHGVHVLTFNDYLAGRDAGWMQSVYQVFGLTARHVEHGLAPAARREAYLADVTYVTAKEAGFDHLRDLLANDAGGIVHRPFHFALVDEADSLMIDEARVPLVIAGAVERGISSAERLAEVVTSLHPGVDYDADEYGRNVELTEAGAVHVERLLACGHLHDERNYTILTELNCALHARVLLHRDVDYIVRDGRIAIVDEFTGRVVHDRHWPDGLQAALEAKEGLARSSDGSILDSLTLQRFLRGYPRLCGMTGTARDDGWELRQTYGVEVVVIPTNRPTIRVDRPDAVFSHREAKEQAVVEDVRRVSASGRPVLIGTLTVEESERLAARLEASGLVCQVLNARNDAAEAAVVARAGAFGAITISTNMAGRGTDVRLGGDDEAERDRVAALGGLYVIGTNRHESRRIDLQLRGRAGRQGDPGESRFFLSLDDDLMVRYGVHALISPRFFPSRSAAPVEHPVVAREIARTQRIIEGQNLEIRRTLARYTGVIEEQRRMVKERRLAVLHGTGAGNVWASAADRYGSLTASAGQDAVERAERAVTLCHIDRLWRAHLAFCADLREGIHLVRLGGQDPLARFSEEAIRAFSHFDEDVDEAVLTAIDHVRIVDGGVDLSALGLKGPSSTWTYLVNDDPFCNQIGSLLTGVGGKTVATYSAAMLMPLLILWGLVDRFFGRPSARRGDTRQGH